MMKVLHTMRRKALALLCRWFPGFKYRMILKACGLECREWQRAFALRQTDYLPLWRSTGKSVAIFLRLLMVDPGKGAEPVRILRLDPDFILHDNWRQRWYFDQYHRMAYKCEACGIPVMKFSRQHFRVGSPPGYAWDGRRRY